MQAMKEWYQTHPHLFHKRPYDRPGCDSYTPDIQTWHGFRATARTMLAERLECDPLVIEAQLAHAVRDANGRAYNRTTYLKQRQTMMQRWADYLDKLAAGADVVQLKRA
jgi:integrase